MTDEQQQQLKELRKIEWWEMMRQKHPGKTDEEIKDVMREYGKRNTGETSHLKNNPDKAREIAKRKKG